MNIIKNLHMPSITRILFLLFLLLLAILLAIFPVWSGISVSPQPIVTSANSENLYLAGDNAQKFFCNIQHSFFCDLRSKIQIYPGR